MSFRLAAFVLAPLLALVLSPLAAPVAAFAEGRSIIVLDGSGSMWGQIDGRPKLEIAREALKTVLAGLPPGQEVGLMAYGHREKGSCSDIELLVPPGTGTAPQIAAAADALQFLGKTPLTQAVREAAEALRSTEEKATVILITDGIETCDADPCALGRELEASGVDFTAHVVGFGLSRDEGRQVACLAEETGGRYLEAANLDSLSEALVEVVLEDPPPQPEPAPVAQPAPAPAALEINFRPGALLAPGVPLPDTPGGMVWELHERKADGSTGDRLWTDYNDMKALVEPGSYRLVAILGMARVETDVTLTADVLAEPEVVMNAARLVLRPTDREGGATLTGAAVTVQTGAGGQTTNYGESLFYVPAGALTVTGSAGQASTSEELTLAPGEIVTRDLVISSGDAVIDGYYVAGLKMENSSHAVSVLAAKAGIDGSRKHFGTNYGPAARFTLPPGDYVAVVELDAARGAAPFSVTAGGETAVPVVLNAGVIHVSAPGATGIELLDARPDADGNHATLSFEYVDEVNKAAMPGEVIARARWGDAVAEATATVTAGERTEVTLTAP
jgi:Ca-activated chloride channel family protein